MRNTSSARVERSPIETVATYQANPVLPAAGKSLSSFPSLPFQARAVQISSGSYWVQVGTDGFIVPPGASGVVHVLPEASPVQPLTLTAPPAGTSPIGPPGLVNPLVIFTDSPNATENPGTLSTPQTVATLSGTVDPVAGFTLDSGLARAATLLLFNTGGVALILDINILINGVLRALLSGGSLAPGVIGVASFGVGTVYNREEAQGGAPQTPAFTVSLPQQIQVQVQAGAAVHYDIRLTF